MTRKFASGFTIPDGREALIVVPTAWGVGATGADAWTNARAAYGADISKLPTMVFHVHPGTTVDDFGVICSPVPHDSGSGPVEIGRWKS